MTNMKDEQQFGLNKIGQIALTVNDIERSIAFYRDTLGMAFLFQADPGLAFFDCGGIRLLLEQTAAENPALYTSTIYYKVDDIKQAFGTLTSRGISFEAQPHIITQMADHTLWMAFFRDPDNNLLALMSEVPI